MDSFFTRKVFVKSLARTAIEENAVQFYYNILKVFPFGLTMYLEVLVVDREVLLHDGPLLLGGALGGAHQVLGVVAVVHPLEAAGAQRRHQRRHDQEVARPPAHTVAQPPEHFLQGVVNYF